MFNFFKKGRKKPPAFTLTKNFYRKDHYFIRNAEWGWLDEEKIFIKHPHKASLITPDPWAQHIFLSAHGSETVEEYVYFVAAQYTEGLPDALEQTIIFELSDLVRAEFIILVKEKQPAPEPFFSPGLAPN